MSHFCWNEKLQKESFGGRVTARTVFPLSTVKTGRRGLFQAQLNRTCSACGLSMPSWSKQFWSEQKAGQEIRSMRVTVIEECWESVTLVAFAENFTMLTNCLFEATTLCGKMSTELPFHAKSFDSQKHTRPIRRPSSKPKLAIIIFQTLSGHQTNKRARSGVLFYIVHKLSPSIHKFDDVFIYSGLSAE